MTTSASALQRPPLLAASFHLSRYPDFNKTNKPAR
jgi:hypothetical protein